jgi:hypothetical protein
VLQTEDLYLGALGLIRGGELRAIEVQGTNGRRLAVFVIAGEGMDAVEREYRQGAALVDLRLLRSEVTRLKNLAFRALREEESRDAGEQGRHRAYPCGQLSRRGRR